MQGKLEHRSSMIGTFIELTSSFDESGIDDCGKDESMKSDDLSSCTSDAEL